MPAVRCRVGCSLPGALSSLAFAWADGFRAGLLPRFLSGVALAGVRMPGLKLPASLAVAELTLRYGRRAIVATCLSSVLVCIAPAATALGSGVAA